MKRVIFLILWVSVIAAGITLGNWQVQRLAWKQELLADIDAAYNGPVHDLERDDLFPPVVTDTVFIRGQLQGAFDPAHTLFITPRVLNDVVGGHAYQLLRLTDGTGVWVNLGFARAAPEPLAGDFNCTVVAYAPEFRGFVRAATGDRLYTPGALQVDANVSPLVAATEVSFNGVTAVGTRPTPNNNHFEYAIFWFTMSGLAFLFGVFLMARSLIKKKKALPN